MNANIMPLSERAQRKNLRDMAHMAQRARDRACQMSTSALIVALREAYADGVEDTLLYIAGDASPSTWLDDIIGADEEQA